MHRLKASSLRDRRRRAPSPAPALGATFAVVLPYYNESAFIARTLRSLLAQTRLPDRLILVDNASTDGSEAVCRAVIRESGYAHATFLHDARPGKANALETGLAAVESTFTVLCDADIHYPAHYLALAERIAAESSPLTVAVMAQIVAAIPAEDFATRRRLRETVFWSRLLRGKCLTGGAGQIFRTEALKRAGGFSTRLWNYVLMDHEVVNRVRKFGESVYHEDLWCLHTDRRADRGRVRWNGWERLIYRYMPESLGDWFFRDFLGPRLRRRKMGHLNLREQPWSEVSGTPAKPLS
jgi:glycosyltransferase involved in cell wall biosynthesis